MDVSANAPPVPNIRFRQARRFFGAAREEARRTWSGRFRWLWRVAGAAALALAALVPNPGFDSWAFFLFCCLACWVPAWLGSDLLAIRFPANDAPLREWAPWEFAARAVGRMGPFLGAQLAWLLVFTGRALAVRIAPGAPRQFIDPLHDATWGTLPGFAFAWSVVFAASGLPYFAAAAAMSATARRPRRLAVVLPVVLVGGAMLFLAVAALPGGAPGGTRTPSLPNQWEELAILFSGVGNLWIGLHSAEFATEVLKHLGLEPENTFAALCWLATGSFVLYALPFWPLTWWITARRYRRWRGADPVEPTDAGG